MINQIYQLVSPRQFEIAYSNKSITDDFVVIRPKYLSICAADQRYFTGSRGKKVMDKKLPMALIHEAVGEVVYDPTNSFSKGDKVVMVPNRPVEKHEYIRENYLRSSQFLSSGYDGFMQDYVFMKPDRVVKLPENINLSTVAITELVTIAYHSINRYEEKMRYEGDSFGVWGDGNLGYITCLLLKKKFPEKKVILFGKTAYKMEHFVFVDKCVDINEIDEKIKVDHVFECVGGQGSESAINQAIDVINPEGTINIMGVSENPVKINTRLVLEKGITIIGSSRSGRTDFEGVIEMYKKHEDILNYLSILVSDVIPVKTVEESIKAFEMDLSKSWGKTVMKWEM